MGVGAFYEDDPIRNNRKENDFSGGINTGFSVFDIRDNQSSDEYGFDTDEYPGLKTSKGRSQHGSSGSGQTNLLTHFGTTQLVRATGTSLSYNQSGTTWTNISGTFANTDWDAVNFRGKLILTNGTDNVKVWNGSTLSDLNASDAPKGKYITASINRVYIAQGSTIYFSANNDESDWTSAENSGADDWTVNGGDVTGLTYFRDQVTAFKVDAMGVYYGNNYFTQRFVTVSNDIGCVSHKTIQEVGNSLYWLGLNDVYVYNGGYPMPIGHPIRKYLDSINKTHINKCCAFTDGIRYYLCLVTESATEPNVRLVYDPRYNIWRVCALNEGYRYGVIFNNIPYVGDASGQIWKALDGDTSSSWSIITKAFDEGIPEAEKEYKELHIQGEFPSGTTITISVSTEEKDGTFVPISYHPTTSSNYAQNRNLIIPLDSIPLTHWLRIKIEGTGPAKIYRIQRYYRLCRVQR